MDFLHHFFFLENVWMHKMETKSLDAVKKRPLVQVPVQSIKTTWTYIDVGAKETEIVTVTCSSQDQVVVLAATRQTNASYLQCHNVVYNHLKAVRSLSSVSPACVLNIAIDTTFAGQALARLLGDELGQTEGLKPCRIIHTSVTKESLHWARTRLLACINANKLTFATTDDVKGDTLALAIAM